MGDKVDAKVISIDNKNKRVNLSIKAYESAEHEKTMKEYGSSDNNDSSLGHILGVALNQVQEKDK